MIAGGSAPGGWSDGAGRPTLRGRDGTVLVMPVDDWAAEASEVERDVLADVEGPAIDLGCGPGRLVHALERMGVHAIGVDTSPRALAVARDRGVLVLERSVFDDLPATGRWGTAILLDGNLGIGGDPVRLLARAAALLDEEGTVLVETLGPGIATRALEVRVERGDERGPWFAWAVVGADGLDEVARAAGLATVRSWAQGGRWFARVGRPGVSCRIPSPGAGAGRRLRRRPG